MIRTLFVSLGLVGLTSLGGVALSKGHDVLSTPMVLVHPIAPDVPENTPFTLTRAIAPVLASVTSPVAPVRVATIDPQITLAPRLSLAPESTLRPLARPGTIQSVPAAPTLAAAVQSTLGTRTERTPTVQVAARAPVTASSTTRSTVSKPRFLMGVYR